jgi:hypothetical protein
MSHASDVYNQLRQAAPNRPGRAFREFDAPLGLSIRAFVDGISRVPGIVLVAARRNVPKNLQFPRFRGATIQVIRAPDGREDDVAYEIIPADRSTEDVFIELAAQMIENVGNASSAKEGLLRFARRIAAWARFFSARGVDGLSRSEELGLIGELLCLEALSPYLGIQASVNSWTGPSGTPHDFQGEWGAVEAKLTTSASPERFRITSERQLDETMVAKLFLFGIVAQESNSAAVSLEKMVQSIRERIDAAAPLARERFDESLKESGYLDADRYKYLIRLSVHQTAFLRVHADFPRIRHDELRSGVFSVKYEIPWASIAPYRVHENELSALFTDSTKQ